MARGKTIDAASEYLGREDVGVIGEIGREELEVVDKPIPMDLIAHEAFMNEIVTVVVHDSNDENESDVVMVGVNGVSQYFRRGTYQDVKRKFVERLARAKSTSYSQNLDERMGESMNVLRPKNALKYPFSIISDANPNGSAWLKAVLSEGQ